VPVPGAPPQHRRPPTQTGQPPERQELRVHDTLSCARGPCGSQPHEQVLPRNA
jgi:hypothetical protein